MRNWARFTAALGALASWPVLALGLGDISVQSHLEQPFAASIPVLGATPAQLDNLTVRLASPEAFNKAGIERSDYLSTLQFKLEKTGALILISSPQIAREPFLNFIVEVQLAQSRLLREYTVLLDPPALAQTPAPAPVTSGQAAAEPELATSEPSSAGTAPSEVPAPTAPRNAPAAASSPATSAPAPAAAETASTTYGPVQAGETLWSIAAKLRPDPSISMDQVLLSLYRTNPSAFENGRLNGLLKGAMLRVPSAADMRSVSTAAAKSKVDALRGGGAAATAESRPAEKPSLPAAESTPTAAPAPSGTETGAAPEAKTAPSQSTESAADSGEKPSAAGQSEPAPGNAPAAPANPAGASPEQPATEAPAPAAAAGQTEPSSPAGTTAPAAPATSTGAAAQPPQTQAPKPAVPTATAEPALSLDQYAKPLGAALVVLIVGFFGWRLVRGRRGGTPGFGQAPAPPSTANKAVGAAPSVSARLATAAAPAADPAQQPVPPRSGNAGALGPAAQSTPSFVAPHAAVATTVLEQPAAQQGLANQMGRGSDVDFALASQHEAQTLTIEQAANDPLSEADFHLAYGLYDEAATLLKQALIKEPQRTELRQKLAETYFAAGKSVEFQETAEALHGQLPAADWQKIALMGRQLCPDAALFKTEAGEPAQSADLKLEESLTALAAETGGQLETAAAPAAPSPPSLKGNVIDFDLDAELLKTESRSAPASQAPEPSTEVPEIDLSQFDLSHEPPPPPDDGKLEFKLDELELEKPSPTESIAVPADEIATKLDLARAYADMGDNEAARGLLQEVMKDGSAAQKSEAEALSKRLSA